MGIASINPATGETLQTFEADSAATVAAKLARGQQAFEQHRHTPYCGRAAWLRAAAQILDSRKAEFGRLMALEVGKPINSAIAEVEKSAWVCRYYADHGPDFLKDEAIATDASHSFVRPFPIGIVLAVMPWNFPFWQVFRFAAPCLLAGNAGVLKHASNVPQSALAIEQIFLDAGVPAGLFQTLLIGSDRVADLLADERIKAATLTGSEAAGASLAAAAGAQIKKTVLELGGSDPFVVTESADLEAAIATAATARLINSGQSCIAAKRFIVAEAIADQFEAGLVQQFQQLKLGDPLDPNVDVGPLATPGIMEDLDQQVQRCVEAGAKVLIGCDRTATLAQLPKNLRAGSFYPPSILSRIPPGTPADQEEFFGPVALVFRVRNLDDAIALANSTPLGLGASAWSQDPAEQARLVNELEAGAVFINGLVKSDPRLPFGGIKRSGYGRELGRPGLFEFVNLKTVWVK
jgi:succinate-semialdehyde dehydrogenase/glutarate-semialdehyde dehydrogenase